MSPKSCWARSWFSPIRRTAQLRRLVAATVAFSLLDLLCARPALAHGFGQSQDLPVPLWLFFFGAAAVVVAGNQPDEPFLVAGIDDCSRCHRVLRLAAGAWRAPGAAALENGLMDAAWS